MQLTLWLFESVAGEHGFLSGEFADLTVPVNKKLLDWEQGARMVFH